MTYAARAPRLLPILVILSLLAGRAGAEPEPAGWVAKVTTEAGVRHLTRDRLNGAVYARRASTLQDAGSNTLTILRQMIEERVVAQEARRLGITVTGADVQKRFDVIDTQVRRQANGNRNLLDVIRRDMKTTVVEFRDGLRYVLMKERVASHQDWIGPLPKNETEKLAQIAVVTAALMKRAKVEYGVPCALQETPSKLPAGHVVHVNGEPITAGELGEELIKRLPTGDIKKIIEEECKSVLTVSWALTPEQMDAVIERERTEWHRVRGLATQEAFHDMPYEQWIKLQYKLDVDTLRRDRYFRGLFGLVQHYRNQVTEEQIQKDWTDNRNTTWGERFLITDFVIAFSPKTDALLGPSAGRTYKEALKLSNALLRRIHSGESFDSVVRGVNERVDENGQPDRTFIAVRKGVRNTGNEVFLYDEAKLLEDEQVSRPFETLTEVHVIRRERRIRPPTFEEIEDTIRQRLASRQAHDALAAKMTDPKVVEIRWPPREP